MWALKPRADQAASAILPWEIGQNKTWYDMMQSRSIDTVLSKNDIHSQNTSFIEEMARYLEVFSSFWISQTQSRGVKMVKTSHASMIKCWCWIERLWNGWNTTVHSFGLASHYETLWKNGPSSWKTHRNTSPHFPPWQSGLVEDTRNVPLAEPAKLFQVLPQGCPTFETLHMRDKIKTSHCNFTANWSMHATHQNINWNHGFHGFHGCGLKTFILCWALIDPLLK